MALRDALLRKALRFAGERSLLEEYITVLLAISQVRPVQAPLPELVASVLDYVGSIHLDSAVQTLTDLLADLRRGDGRLDQSETGRPAGRPIWKFRSLTGLAGCRSSPMTGARPLPTVA